MKVLPHAQTQEFDGQRSMRSHQSNLSITFKLPDGGEKDKEGASINTNN